MLARVPAGTSPVLPPSPSITSPAVEKARVWLQRVSDMMEILRANAHMLWPPMTMEEASGLACELAKLPCDCHVSHIDQVLMNWKLEHDAWRREDAARIFAWLKHQRRGIDT